jgi:hypothetical protein
LGMAQAPYASPDHSLRAMTPYGYQQSISVRVTANGLGRGRAWRVPFVVRPPSD